jgi:preprotein translocase SecE subunit
MADQATKVRRIKAQEAEIVKKPAKITKPKKAKVSDKKAKARQRPAWLDKLGKPFQPIGQYVKGSWQELRQTRWPNRRATWSLTIAVIVFCVFFAALILLFDILFEFVIKNLNSWSHDFFNLLTGNNG